MEEFYKIMQAIRELGERISSLEEAMRALYLPSPDAAERQRSMKPFTKSFRGDKRVPYDANAIPNYRGAEMFLSPVNKTNGFTHHNCFVNIELAKDTVPPDTGDHLLFTAVLEGSSGSGFVELDSVQLFSTGRTGSFQVPLLSSESLAIDTRFRLFAGDNATYEQPPPASHRLIKFTITGVLTSGYQS